MRLPIPNDWDGVSYCRFAICWPDSVQWKAILRGYATQIARGWTWDEKSGDLLATLVAARSTLDYNIELHEVIMACNDGGLSELAAAVKLLASAQCCDGGAPQNGGAQGTVESGGETYPIWGGVPPVEIPGGEVPPGYEGDFAQYLQDKCNASHAILTGIITTCRNWAYINFAQTAGLVALCIAALGGWVILPVFLVPVLIAGAIGLVGVQAGLVGLADGLESKRNEIVCLMVQSDSSTAIIGGMANIIGSILALIPATGAMAVFLRLVAGLLFNTDTLNQLFNMTTGVWPDQTCNCNDCDPEQDIINEFETGTDGFAIDPLFGSDIPEYDGVVGIWNVTWESGTQRLRNSQSQAAVPNTKSLMVKAIDHVIGEGDHLISNATANATVTLHISLFTPGKTYIHGFSAGSFNNGPIDVDLSSFAGQNVGYIAIWVAKETAAVYYCEFLMVNIECQL